MSGCDPRTIVLADQSAMVRGSLISPSPPATWPTKDPLTRVFRGVDFACVLQGRQIVSVGRAASGVTIAGVSVTGSLVSLTLDDGATGVPARVELAANCSDGTVEPVAIILPILSTLTLPPEGDVTPATFSTVTTGSTPGALGSVPIIAVTGASVNLRGTVVARNPETGDTASWDLAAQIKGWGTPQAVVTQQGDPPYEADAALVECTVTVAVSGAFVTLIVTGVAGALLTWSANLNWTAA
jgi:hypothetical protein